MNRTRSRRKLLTLARYTHHTGTYTRALYRHYHICRAGAAYNWTFLYWINRLAANGRNAAPRGKANS